MTKNDSPVAKPISSGERIRELDIIRGFALFGVLLVNIAMFNTTLFSEMASVSPMSNPLHLDGLSDRISAVLIQIFAQGKFYTIFSFLFGLGFYIFMERAESKNRSANYLFARRSFILVLFGILHFVFVWYGDILHVYGIIAFLLMLFRNRSIKTIRNWIVALLILSTLIFSGFAFLNDYISTIVSNEVMMDQYNNIYIQMEQSVEIYSNGSFVEIVAYRMKNEFPVVASQLVFLIPKILGMFLIGLYVGKRRIFNNVENNVDFIRKVWRWGGAIGILTTLGYVLIQFNLMQPDSLFYNSSIALFKEISTVFLSMFYVTSLILLYQKTPFKRFLYPLSYMGRMALTNYLVQCILCSFIFYGYGLGLLNKASIATGILLTILIYTAQVFFSMFWLKKYHYGPVEWLWRHLTYN
ncbi:protein of unknown function DUF405 [Alkaliphilus metalliredigens QYMF]|uniref:DUF418 domain-containing protein n=1 Tax=Alkaliphilus metalliredigens (strain QYMF) TaxID=293826 RepID=A6TNB9_ALKMQ|nr:DUF418 domain-containing protein [Alkaliphilus metalliredigens]ABR47687.1 protein of unknown function DUF405 [Alkaliphilus metalliredigens QYMF]